MLDKIELDVIFEGLRLMMAAEFRLCCQILEHLEVGLELVRQNRLDEYESQMKAPWAAVEQTKQEMESTRVSQSRADS